jgi:hypothetical protein
MEETCAEVAYKVGVMTCIGTTPFLFTFFIWQLRVVAVVAAVVNRATAIIMLLLMVMRYRSMDEDYQPR